MTTYAPTPEALRIAQDNVEPTDLEEVATYQARVDAAYKRVYERANELVSPNSPEYESLLVSLTEKYLEEEVTTRNNDCNDCMYANDCTLNRAIGCGITVDNSRVETRGVA